MIQKHTNSIFDTIWNSLCGIVLIIFSIFTILPAQAQPNSFNLNNLDKTCLFKDNSNQTFSCYYWVDNIESLTIGDLDSLYMYELKNPDKFTLCSLLETSSIVELKNTPLTDKVVACENISNRSSTTNTLLLARGTGSGESFKEIECLQITLFQDINNSSDRTINIVDNSINCKAGENGFDIEERDKIESLSSSTANDDYFGLPLNDDPVTNSDTSASSVVVSVLQFMLFLLSVFSLLGAFILIPLSIISLFTKSKRFKYISITSAGICVAILILTPILYTILSIFSLSQRSTLF